MRQILDRAEVGRAIFYANFRNKDDLLVDDLPFVLIDFRHPTRLSFRRCPTTHTIKKR